LYFVVLQLPSKAGSSSLTSVLSDKLPKSGSRVRDPFDDDFEDGFVSQSNLSSQTTSTSTSSAFDDQFAVSTSQSLSSLAFSAGN